MKNILKFNTALLGIFLACGAEANGYFSMPGSPQMPYGQYRFQSGDFSCEAPASSGGPQLDYGLYGKQSEVNSRAGGVASEHRVGQGFGGAQSNDVGLYARMVIPLGRPNTIDCAKYYELELERKRLELEMMKIEMNERKSITGGGMEFKKN